MNADGSEQTNLTNSARDEQSPEFTIDGSKIVFRIRAGKKTKRYIMNPDGSGLTVWTDSKYLDALFPLRTQKSSQ